MLKTVFPVRPRPHCKKGLVSLCQTPWLVRFMWNRDLVVVLVVCGLPSMTFLWSHLSKYPVLPNPLIFLWFLFLLSWCSAFYPWAWCEFSRYAVQNIFFYKPSICVINKEKLILNEINISIYILFQTVSFHKNIKLMDKQPIMFHLKCCFLNLSLLIRKEWNCTDLHPFGACKSEMVFVC